MPLSSDDPIFLTLDAEIAHLVPRYLANRQRDVISIAEMLGRKGYVELEDIGHNLHGQGSSYGCAGISAIGQMLEAAAQQHDDDAIRHQAAALDHYLRHVRLIDQ